MCRESVTQSGVRENRTHRSLRGWPRKRSAYSIKTFECRRVFGECQNARNNEAKVINRETGLRPG